MTSKGYLYNRAKSPTSMLSTFAILILYVGSVTPTHRPYSDIDPQLILAADVLRNSCDNFYGCDIDNSGGQETLCCLRCSCDPSCVESHSCCPESGYHPDGEVPYFSGLEGMVCRNGQRVGIPKAGVFQNPEYEFFESCPKDAPIDIKDGCERGYSMEPVSLIGSLPLYDVTRRINYANRYCAQCNNASDADLLLWKPSVKCRRTIDSTGMGLSGFDGWMASGVCSLAFKPPDIDVNDTLCYNDVIRTCNVTGNWATYDAQTALLCNVLDMLFVVLLKNETRTYRNIFCAKCNGEETIVTSWAQCPVEISNDFSNSFSTILQFTIGDLDLTTDSQSELNSDSNNCLGNFAFDPLMGKCMPVYCFTPKFLDVSAFHCRTIFGEISKANIGHTHLILFNETANFSSAQDKAQEAIDMVASVTAYQCSVTVFYQTVLSANNSLDNIVFNSSAEVFNGLYMNLQYIILGEFPENVWDNITQTIESIFTDNAFFYYKGPDTFDAGILKYIENENLSAIHSRDDVAAFDLTGPSHFLFRNPYTETILIGEQNSWAFDCSTELYKTDYLPCPAFRYDVALFSKTSSGLRIVVNEEVVEFSFDEFSTARPNSTEVNICFRSVTDKVTPLISRQSTISPSTNCWIMVIICVISVVF